MSSSFRSPYKRHSSPATAGAHNLPPGYHKEARRKDVNKIMKRLLPISDRGRKNKQEYAGKWDEESLAHEVNEFFKYCAEFDVKPAKAGLRLWLDLSRSQYHAWETQATGYKSDILEKAAAMIEMSYIGNIESHPTGNIFLLKSSHNHTDRSEIEVTGQGVDKQDIRDQLIKAGLTKIDKDD